MFYRFTIVFLNIYVNGYSYVLVTSVNFDRPGRVAQAVTCLATDASLTADPGVACSIPAWHGHILSWRSIIKKILWSFSSLPLNHSRRVVVRYKRKHVHEVLLIIIIVFFISSTSEEHT